MRDSLAPTVPQAVWTLNQMFTGVFQSECTERSAKVAQTQRKHVVTQLMLSDRERKTLPYGRSKMI